MKRLYVGSLPEGATDKTLRSLFDQFGTVELARVMTDQGTGRSKGFGFVEMSTSSEAAKAMTSLNGTELEGQSIVVNEARPVGDREGRGGFGDGRRRY
jgi:cold-inducible RNA-binding protein